MTFDNFSAKNERWLLNLPLVCDLDGTLLRQNTLHEGIVSAAFSNSRGLLQALFTLLRSGKVAFKEAVHRSARPGYLKEVPEHPEVLSYLKSEQAKGREIHLYTGAHQSVAEEVATRWPALFASVVGSSGDMNNVSNTKSQALVSRFREYEYIGDSSQDLPPLLSSVRPVLASDGKRKTYRPFRAVSNLEFLLVQRASLAQTITRQMRVHQYLKNLLIFVSIMASQNFSETDLWLRCFLGFAVFSLGASAVYILNDLVDLDSDRNHAHKRTRPIAGGDLTIQQGASIGLSLLAVAIFVSLSLGFAFTLTTLIYLVISAVYSLWLKRLAPLDVFILAGLYTLRVWAGGVAIGQSLSFWLLSFSIFTFLSLALVKRYSELAGLNIFEEVLGRGYRKPDTPVVLASGLAAAFASAIVLALYADSPEVSNFYVYPQVVWLLVPLTLYWQLTLWFKAGRGEMHSDPVVFAFTNKQSALILVLLGLIFVVATGASKL